MTFEYWVIAHLYISGMFATMGMINEGSINAGHGSAPKGIIIYGILWPIRVPISFVQGMAIAIRDLVRGQ